MQTHTGSRGRPFHAFEFCNLYLWLKAKPIKVNRNLESVVDTKVLEQGFQPKLYTESMSQGLFSGRIKKKKRILSLHGQPDSVKQTWKSPGSRHSQKQILETKQLHLYLDCL